MHGVIHCGDPTQRNVVVLTRVVLLQLDGIAALDVVDEGELASV